MTFIGRSGHPRFLRYVRNDFELVFAVAGCFEAVITEREARELPMTRDFKRLAVERMTPFVWLSMPGHEGVIESVLVA